jgi:hypothetical protein
LCHLLSPPLHYGLYFEKPFGGRAPLKLVSKPKRRYRIQEAKNFNIEEGTMTYKDNLEREPSMPMVSQQGWKATIQTRITSRASKETK